MAGVGGHCCCVRRYALTGVLFFTRSVASNDRRVFLYTNHEMPFHVLFC